MNGENFNELWKFYRMADNVANYFSLNAQNFIRNPSVKNDY